MNLRAYVRITDNGFSYGLEDSSGKRYFEKTISPRSHSIQSIQQSHRVAMLSSKILESMWTRRPDLVRKCEEFRENGY